MTNEIIPVKRIAQARFVICDQKVMLYYDLAALYGVEARALNQAVKRNANRFPVDFMFRLPGEEMESVSQFVIPKVSQREDRKGPNSSQIVMSSRKYRDKCYRPYAFTEQDVAMLSSVLNSERAVKVNIAIMRAFVKLRQALETNREPAQKFADLERRAGKHDEEISAIIEAIRQLMGPPEKPGREIGFHVRERTARYKTRRIR